MMTKRAQGITEYALVIAVVAVALLAMQVYFKRGVQSVVKVSVDQVAGFDSGLTPGAVQNMAIQQELDPKYGILKFYEVKNTTEQSLSVTTRANGEKSLKINKWEERVEDKDLARGKKFYQELEN